MSVVSLPKTTLETLHMTDVSVRVLEARIPAKRTIAKHPKCRHFEFMVPSTVFTKSEKTQEICSSSSKSCEPEVEQV
jgi:hypothetical protein